ncbi:hypothetical protein [Thermosulfidibacter takaii]|uniref:hypothetical protein n=1 Tax=Thermosulfidibacter takaii TaxID=412593 RepID=UPI0008388667|nr:hypothetical protein [Thermosulfidibacter takaii]
MITGTTRRGRRPKIQSSYKVKVTTPDGRSWVEERCWKCSRVLRKHPSTNLYVKIEQIQCPTCKAINLVEGEE